MKRLVKKQEIRSNTSSVVAPSKAEYTRKDAINIVNWLKKNYPKTYEELGK